MDHHQHHHHHHQESSMTVNTTMAMVHKNHAMHPESHSMHKTGHEHQNHNHGMSMTFHLGINDLILFNQWNPSTVTGFVFSWILIFLVAVLYEGLKTLRENLSKHDSCQCNVDSATNSADPSKEANLLPGGQTQNVRRKKNRLLSVPHFIQTFLHVLQMGISYLLMLIAMTFNVYLFLAVILGAGTGYFLFAWKRRNVLDCNDHCH